MSLLTWAREWVSQVSIGVHRGGKLLLQIIELLQLFAQVLNGAASRPRPFLLYVLLLFHCKIFSSLVIIVLTKIYFTNWLEGIMNLSKHLSFICSQICLHFYKYYWYSRLLCSVNEVIVLILCSLQSYERIKSLES